MLLLIEFFSLEASVYSIINDLISSFALLFCVNFMGALRDAKFFFFLVLFKYLRQLKVLSEL